MVFKPWTDIKTPRHLVSDLDDLTPSMESPVPSVTVKLTEEGSKLSGKLLVLPQSLKFIQEAFKATLPQDQQADAVIGVIEIRNQATSTPRTEQNDQEEQEDYSLEEQLYQAHPSDFVSGHNADIQITQSQGITFIVVPNFNTPILFNLLAQSLSQHCEGIQEILTITPGQSAHLTNLTKLSNSKSQSYETIPTLTPPYYITGIAASLLTQSDTCSKRLVTALVLQSEGPQGYEKVNNDSISEVSFPLAQFIGTERKNLLKSMRNEIRGTANNFALYL
ncbi:hypothetical protein WICPIJ_006920 [Wickerhamomyces pijperi]|uniref:Proteasome assembly chaperone 1 n=1 Tax=Wickerhamomyces pijperi TaxID=599730 RepID=A0A9P8Q1I0_WICPI|nr:hypothetical protein WICPIJ_006920 [Wickerhamomyces pijperi]